MRPARVHAHRSAAMSVKALHTPPGRRAVAEAPLLPADRCATPETSVLASPATPAPETVNESRSAGHGSYPGSVATFPATERRSLVPPILPGTRSLIALRTDPTRQK